jgi:hypothetical protein
VACLHLGQGFQRECATFFFLINPGRQGLLDDPATGTIQTCCDLVDAFGERQR